MSNEMRQVKKDLQTVANEIDLLTLKAAPRVRHYLMRARGHLNEAMASMDTAEHTELELPLAGLTDDQRRAKLAKP